jgi:acetylornithine deacetylase/succinyl-diaminopimelate desuccinylase-like protein
MFAAPLLSMLALAAAPADDRPLKGILASPSYLAAVSQLDREHDRIVEDIVTLTEIPAPPFAETKRATAYLEMLKQAGLENVEIDAEGNVMGLYRGTGAPDGKLVMLAAHLDTVFSAQTNVKVRRDGNRLYAPGIGDNSRSLSVLLAYARALKANTIRTEQDILFVGNVGEEGPGDLRGVRHMFTQGKYSQRIGTFISMDGLESERVVNGGVGSKRYRVTFKGPGGHSYRAFGLVNPMTAMSHTVVELYKLKVPATPKTTYSASVVNGGTSVNSIPNEVFMEFDMRSEDPNALAKVEKAFLAIVHASVEGENKARSVSEGKVEAEIKLIGDRPAGSTPATADIVNIASGVIRAKGLTPSLAYSSTDSNFPMSIGVPAVTIGSGGTGDRAHSLDEWIDVERSESVRGMSIGLGILLAAAGAK